MWSRGIHFSSLRPHRWTFMSHTATPLRRLAAGLSRPRSQASSSFLPRALGRFILRMPCPSCPWLWHLIKQMHLISQVPTPCFPRGEA